MFTYYVRPGITSYFLSMISHPSCLATVAQVIPCIFISMACKNLSSLLSQRSVRIFSLASIPPVKTIFLLSIYGQVRAFLLFPLYDFSFVSVRSVSSFMSRFCTVGRNGRSVIYVYYLSMVSEGFLPLVSAREFRLLTLYLCSLEISYIFLTIDQSFPLMPLCGKSLYFFYYSSAVERGFLSLISRFD